MVDKLMVNKLMVEKLMVEKLMVDGLIGACPSKSISSIEVPPGQTEKQG